MAGDHYLILDFLFWELNTFKDANGCRSGQKYYFSSSSSSSSYYYYYYYYYYLPLLLWNRAITSDARIHLA